MIPQPAPGVPRPPRRRPQSLGDLPFPRLPAVRWFNPRTLLTTARLVLLSAMFAEYADKREIQAVIPLDEPFHDLRGLDPPQLDYVSDLGDGFDATYSVAYLLAQAKLDLDDHGGASLPRSPVLVMGGDEVYPYASATAYEQRTKGPYVAALPEPDGHEPLLFALPGNHDWYDGLTSFLRFFCQGEAIGGWRTRQQRSYFALRLPHQWWLLAIDIQLDTYIDSPQIDYFRTVAAQLGPDDGIILCTGKPSWIEGGREGSRAYATIDYFVTRVLGVAPDRVRLMLSGDLHHYARYREQRGDRTLVHCGGGGAYLSGTDEGEDLVLPPTSLHEADAEPTPGTTFHWQAAYPSPAQSRRLRAGVLHRLATRNPWFVVLMAALQSLLAYLSLAGLAPLLVAGTVLALAMAAFARRGGGRGVLATAAGAAHGLAHVALAYGLVRLLDGPAAWVVVPVAGGAVATLLFSAYLLACSTAGFHHNEVFSAQSIEDHKSFLRLELHPDHLTVHPVAVPRICHRWAVSPESHGPWLQPATPLRARLAEPPCRVSRRPG